MKIKLTAFQTTEVAHGMEIDASMGRVTWGTLRYGKSRKQATLEITGLAAALWRITSVRDIWQDNAADGLFEYAAGARSLVGLVNKIVAEAGGRDAVLALPQEPWGVEAGEETIGGSNLKGYV